MKYLVAVILTNCMVAVLFSQDTVGIQLNRHYMSNAAAGNWSVYISPPPLAGNTLRYLLGQAYTGKAEALPPNWLSFDIGIHKFLSTHFSLGLQYQHSSASLTKAAVHTGGSYAVTDLNVNSDNIILSGRYHYQIVLKNRWDREKHPISAERLRRSGRRIVLFSGLGVGYGKLTYKPAISGNYQYPEIPRLSNFVFGIETIGMQYWFNRHWGLFFSLGSFNTGIYTSGHAAGVFISP